MNYEESAAYSMNYEESAAYINFITLMTYFHSLFKIKCVFTENPLCVDQLTVVHSLSSAKHEIEHIKFRISSLRHERGLFETGAWPNYFLFLILQLKYQTKIT